MLTNGENNKNMFFCYKFTNLPFHKYRSKPVSLSPRYRSSLRSKHQISNGSKDPSTRNERKRRKEGRNENDRRGVRREIV